MSQEKHPLFFDRSKKSAGGQEFESNNVNIPDVTHNYDNPKKAFTYDFTGCDLLEILNNKFDRFSSKKDDLISYGAKVSVLDRAKAHILFERYPAYIESLSAFAEYFGVSLQEMPISISVNRNNQHSWYMFLPNDMLPAVLQSLPEQALRQKLFFPDKSVWQGPVTVEVDLGDLKNPDFTSMVDSYISQAESVYGDHDDGLADSTENDEYSLPEDFVIEFKNCYVFRDLRIKNDNEIYISEYNVIPKNEILAIKVTDHNNYLENDSMFSRRFIHEVDFTDPDLDFSSPYYREYIDRIYMTHIVAYRTFIDFKQSGFAELHDQLNNTIADIEFNNLKKDLVSALKNKQSSLCRRSDEDNDPRDKSNDQRMGVGSVRRR